MSVGTYHDLDKSLLQALNLDEAVWFDNFLPRQHHAALLRGETTTVSAAPAQFRHRILNPPN
jgi:hypothetical protein